MKKYKEWLKEAVGELNLVATEFEADGMSYMDSAVSVTQVYDLIDQLDEPEKVVIPQFVADFIEKWKNEYLTMSEWFNFNYDDDEEHEVFKWLYDNDYEENTRREYLLINAIRYGYEVEKEQLYYVLDKHGKTLLMLMGGEVCTSGGYVLSESTFTKDIYQLTEKQIKDYDQRFWSFALEVTE